MKRPLLALCAVAATLFAASAAEAGGVSWSVGVNVPPVATYVSAGPAWYPAPVRYAPPVAYAPAPVYVEPYVGVYDAPYGVYAAPVYHRRAPYWVVPAHRWHPGWNRHDRWHHEGGYRR
ncbi:MAG TPA: hypothetical protein VLD35_13190 [Caldimonas sp.]|nr:hypothetical protein [Caldimonas sp.]